jgi:hypothetical protein
MRVIVNFNNHPTIQIGDDGPYKLAPWGLHLQAMIILGESGIKISTILSPHLIHTYEVPEDTANLLRYILDSPDSIELERKIGGVRSVKELGAMVDKHVEARKEFEALITPAHGKGGGSISIPLNSGALRIRPVTFSTTYHNNPNVFLFDIKTLDLHIQYLTVLFSASSLLYLKNDPIKKVVSDLNSPFMITDGYIKINGKDYTIKVWPPSDQILTTVIRRGIPVKKVMKVQKLSRQYKSDIITAIMKDIPLEALTALK